MRHTYSIAAIIAFFTACSNIESATTEDIKKACNDKKWEEAKLMCEAYIKKDAQNPIVFKYLGDAYLMRKDSAFALFSYKKAIELDSTYVEAIVSKAEVMMNGDNAPAAIKMLNEKISYLPEESQLYNALGCAFHVQKNDNEARFNFEKALKIDADNIPARRNLAILQMNHYELEDAILNFQTILDKDSKLANVHNYLGLAYAFNKNDKEAEEEFKTAIKCDSKYVEAYENLAYHYEKQEKLDLAKKYFKKASALGSENAKNLLKNDKFK